jgi:hypothetical protein
MAVSGSTEDLLPALQDQLGKLYDVELTEDVRDYLLTDAAVARALAGDGAPRADEQLLVMQHDDGVDVALFLDAEVLGRLAAADPRRRLSGENLADFWTVLEGISHFNYLVWNAARDKAVTLLELEMQAEVDKYVATRLMLANGDETRLGGSLLGRLFDETVLDPGLDAESRERYRQASAFAASYCTRLAQRYPRGGVPLPMQQELRSFFRLPQREKVSRIRDGD